MYAVTERIQWVRGVDWHLMHNVCQRADGPDRLGLDEAGGCTGSTAGRVLLVGVTCTRRVMTTAK